MPKYVFSTIGDLVSEVKGQGQFVEIIDIEFCHFHGSGPIGSQRENTKWPISQKQEIF